MWLAYLDEAGNTGRRLDDPNQPIHLIGSVLIAEDQIMVVHDHLRDVARCRCGAIRHESGFEFHGQAIFSGSGFFSGMAPTERIELYEDILDILRVVSAKVIVRGVHKPRLAARYPSPFHPHDIALMFMCESIERFGRNRDALILLVADEAREVEDAALRDLANYQRLGTSWGWDVEPIDHIIDTIHFVRSETNAAIQLADCVTFLAGRIRRSNTGVASHSQAVDDLWNTYVVPVLGRNQIWYPS